MLSHTLSYPLLSSCRAPNPIFTTGIFLNPPYILSLFPFFPLPILLPLNPANLLGRRPLYSSALARPAKSFIHCGRDIYSAARHIRDCTGYISIFTCIFYIPTIYLNCIYIHAQ